VWSRRGSIASACRPRTGRPKRSTSWSAPVRRGSRPCCWTGKTELPLTNLRIEGTLLKGNVATSEGIGELVLQVGDGSVIGTLAVNGKLLLIEGDHHE
jgi:hypothetical protein